MNCTLKFLLSSGFAMVLLFPLSAQNNGAWQQSVKYKMEIDFDISTHQFTGLQELTYFNLCPDTIYRVYYHLYFNAFQPSSMMDIRSRTISDPDRRVGKRIQSLQPEEIGYHKITSLKQDGKKIQYQVNGTILEVDLKEPLLPGTKTKLVMEFNSQVPIQIRRSGRNNKEGIEYSMSQWYPKLAEYDQDGWHANPYIGREFHGVWGDFDVKIKIDSAYTLGGTGVLQNPEAIGKGYAAKTSNSNAKLNWHFKAEKVHDFAWAADSHYVHTSVQVPDGPLLHFFHENDTTIAKRWEKMKPLAVQCFEIMNGLYGAYPYPQYSVIQAGDGGMEYPMTTFISGRGKLGALVSVTVHEAIHSWFQGLLATNESKYAWMDEGFTSYAQHIVLDSLYKRKKLNPHSGSYAGYFRLVQSGVQEPLSTHADHFSTNRAYGTAAYSMGCIFLHQLGYIIGEDQLQQGLRRYFSEWKYKHPTPRDLKRIMEKVSGIELDWYFEYWIHTTKTIDYGIQTVIGDGKKSRIRLQRLGEMPMPLDVVVYLKDGTELWYNIPLRIMRGEKEKEGNELITQMDWPWTFPSYELEVPHPIANIEKIVIDPSERMADVHRKNNTFPNDSETFFQKNSN